jgi:hypothetical protein
MHAIHVANDATDEWWFLMSNIRGHTSGLPMNIWIGPRGRARHAARIKVQMDHRVQFDFEKLAVVTVESQPRLIAGHLSAEDLELVRRYIALNRAAILNHWYEKTDGAELASELKRLRT